MKGSGSVRESKRMSERDELMVAKHLKAGSIKESALLGLSTAIS